jgi:hypothetical protein
VVAAKWRAIHDTLRRKACDGVRTRSHHAGSQGQFSRRASCRECSAMLLCQLMGALPSTRFGPPAQIKGFYCKKSAQFQDATVCRHNSPGFQDLVLGEIDVRARLHSDTQQAKNRLPAPKGLHSISYEEVARPTSVATVRGGTHRASLNEVGMSTWPTRRTTKLSSRTSEHQSSQLCSTLLDLEKRCCMHANILS